MLFPGKDGEEACEFDLDMGEWYNILLFSFGKGDSMFIRNGINSILRERGRTALFSLLIMLLTLTMLLSLSVLLYCNCVLDAGEEAYRSIALVEYMGTEYPDEDEPDAAARAAAAALSDETVLSVPGVTAWTRGSTAFAYTEGFEYHSGNLPYGNRAVIVVSQVSEPISQWIKFDKYNQPIVEEGRFEYRTCILKSSIYSRHGREDTYIDILTNDSGFVPEKGKCYVLNGSFVDTSGTAQNVGVYPKNGYKIFRVESFISDDALPYAEYIEGEEIPRVFCRAAEQYRIMNSFVHVVPCRDVNDVYAFHQNEIQLSEGEMPDPGSPYACVVTYDLANSLGLKPGDSFSMSELRGTEEDRYNLGLTGETQTYTVSGVTSDSYDYIGTVWVVAEDADTPLFGYLLGTVSLRNEGAEEAVEMLRALVPEQVRVTLLDQGYGSAVQPFREVRKTAVNALLICCAGIAAILLLFAFLYVGRQQSTVRIMVSLGTPGRSIVMWFLSGATVICGAAAVLGTVLGTLFRPAVFRMIAEAAAANREEGFLWYSETVVGVVKQTSFAPQVPLWPNLLAVPVVVAIALLFCLRFLRMARRDGTRSRGKSRVRIPRGKSSALRMRGLGFALLSIRRGGLRSLVVPLVSLALTVTVLVLGGVYQKWQNELDDALENASIEGMVVSLNGRYYSGLALSVDNVRTLLDVEGVDEVSVSFGYHYWLPEDEPGFTYGAFGREHRLEWIGTQPELVALNSLSAAKEFYYTDAALTWLDGWDETMLQETDFTPLIRRSEAAAEEKVIPAVCSASFLEEHGMTLGDSFNCLVQVGISTKYQKEVPLTLQAVGSYVQQGGKAHTYVPLACHIPQALLSPDGDTVSVREKSMYSFRTCRFRLSAGELESVRQQLRERGFSAVGHITGNRTTMLLRDSSFLILKENMERNISMGKVMSTAISILVVLLGFIISWLMIFSRRREFALMRGCGAQKRRVFASFFLEQAILSLAGCLAGSVVFFWMYAGGMTQPLAVAAYLMCYLLGAAISILMIGKTNLMELFTVRE